ncbi:MAG: hypothetical protein KDM91_00805 [Verrucomicrobiae bacterium]|nr:hypothetical protein [Verrucomicrobiae bacterium]MCP5539920.1 hypothetical protein [Akkermansiaceae bacterium]
MKVEDLMDEVAHLDPAGRRRLIAYAVTLQDAEIPGYAERLAEKIDNRDPSHWIDEEDLASALRLDEPEP